MRFKVGNTWYDSNEQPLMVELSETEKELVKDMPGELHYFCSFPDGALREDIEAFMEIPKETH